MLLARNIKMIQIRNVPDDLHRSLKERAARDGTTMSDLMDLPIERYGHEVLVPRIWELRPSFSAYDATYVALAEALGPETPALLTTDGRLARAVRDRGTVAVVHAG